MSILYVSMTVDWEGTHFKNVGDLMDMRKAIEKVVGAIPFTHFVCPSYWLNESRGANPKKQIFGAASKHDEIGLHVHCRKELIEKVDVPFLLDDKTNLGDESGHGIPLGVYSQHLAERILNGSRRFLAESLELPSVPGFRCGAWMASDAVLKALMSCGFVYDASALPPVIFSQGYSRGNEGDLKDTTGDGNGLFTKTILRLWGYTPEQDVHVANSLSLRWNARQAITPTTVPFKLFDQGRSLIEMPNNAGLCDYASCEFMIDTFDKLSAAAQNAAEPLFFNLGCHQEGSAGFKRRLTEFFEARGPRIRELRNSGRVHFSTVLDASKAADLYMVD